MKYRKKLLLDTEIVNFLKNVCFEISEIYCFEFDAIGIDGDHVHLFVGAEPKYSPSKVIKLQKVLHQGKSSNNTLKSKNRFGVENCGVMENILEL